MSREVSVSDTGMGSCTGYFWLQLIFLRSPLCRRWIFPLTRLEPSLFSMTTLLVPRHGAHVPFHLGAAQLCQPCPHWGRDGAGAGVKVCQELLRAPRWFCAGSSLLWLACLQLSRGLSVLLTLGFSAVWHDERFGQERCRAKAVRAEALGAA